MTSEIKIDLILIAFKNWLDNQADENDILDVYCETFPIECGRLEPDGISSCINQSNKNCVECIFNCNNPLPKDYAVNHFERF